MSDARTPEEWLELLPGWEGRPATAVPLTSGFNHLCYRVDSGGYQYVLRIAASGTIVDPQQFGRECRLQQQAARAGLAPPVLHAEPTFGLILSEYLPGTVWTREHLQERSNLQALAELLRQLHDLPGGDVMFDATAAADKYLADLQAGDAFNPLAESCRRIVESIPAPTGDRFCHNDVVASNLIMGDKLHLIDFEYAASNDPMFDLASVIGWHNLAARESEWLLAAYADGNSSELHDRLHEQLRLFDALQWLWLAVQQQQRPDEQLKAQMARVEKRI